MNYVPKALAEGAKWLRLVAERGDMAAQVSLGICYEKGNGVPKDSVEAAKWYRMAAEQGNASGQQLLGFCYAQGQGAPKDYVEAYKWFNLATAQGLDFGDRHELEQQMTAEQIAEAQRLTREFKPRSEQPFSNKRTTDSYPTASGTGFFITDDGYLITNEHVVKDAAQVRLVTSAGLISARVVKVDTANDLALLKADIIRPPQLGFLLDNGVVTKFSSLPIAASRAVKLGGVVVTVGFPNIGLQGFAPKFARGEIASLSGAGDDARYFQISVPVQPGNSGGALVDERGNVVGVVSAKLNAAVALASSGSLPENVNYAVKSSYLLSFLESVPDVSAKLKEATGKEIKFEEVVEKAKQAAVLVLVY
jgi:S1-C subfamily serine protease